MGKNQKVEVEKTVKRMPEVRVNDTLRLRKNIEAKLKWAKEEQKKGLLAIENAKKNIQINTGELLKLKGIILVLTQLIEENNERANKE